MSDDRNKFQIAGLFPPWERSSFEAAKRTPKSASVGRSYLLPTKKRGMTQRQAARLADDDGELTAVFSSSSPIFRSLRTFFLLYYVIRLKIVLTLTLYLFFRQILTFFLFFLLTQTKNFFAITPIQPILTLS